MRRTPRGMRLHIGLYGRRNSGKSSILNALTGQKVSIVSEIPGTTTDPVYKSMELKPVGPVVFIDTAGLDDHGSLGEERIRKTTRAIERTDLGIIVSSGSRWGEFETRLLEEFNKRKVPAIIVLNKIDIDTPDKNLSLDLEKKGLSVIRTNAVERAGISSLREAIIREAPDDFINSTPILADLVNENSMAVLVTPIDREAPTGRLILPQVQTMRDLLDHGRTFAVCQTGQLREVLASLRIPPGIVVTDSQAFREVAGITPQHIPLTSFSILFSRFKGNLKEQVKGTLAVDSLRKGDRVLIAEACSHHPVEDDIGTVKIPAWMDEYKGFNLDFEHVRGHSFTRDISAYSLVIHCGACMLNRREVLSRIRQCLDAGVPVTNYGLTIAYSLGILDRALEPFRETHELFNSIRMKMNSGCGKERKSA